MNHDQTRTADGSPLACLACHSGLTSPNIVVRAPVEINPTMTAGLTDSEFEGLFTGGHPDPPRVVPSGTFIAMHNTPHTPEELHALVVYLRGLEPWWEQKDCFCQTRIDAGPRPGADAGDAAADSGEGVDSGADSAGGDGRGGAVDAQVDDADAASDAGVDSAAGSGWSSWRSSPAANRRRLR